MTRYDFQEAIQVILSNVQTNINLILFQSWSNFKVNWPNNDQIWLPIGWMRREGAERAFNYVDGRSRVTELPCISEIIFHIQSVIF